METFSETIPQNMETFPENMETSPENIYGVSKHKIIFWIICIMLLITFILAIVATSKANSNAKSDESDESDESEEIKRLQTRIQAVENNSLSLNNDGDLVLPGKLIAARQVISKKALVTLGALDSYVTEVCPPGKMCTGLLSGKSSSGANWIKPRLVIATPCEDKEKMCKYTLTPDFAQNDTDGYFVSNSTTYWKGQQYPERDADGIPIGSVPLPGGAPWAPTPSPTI